MIVTIHQPEHMPWLGYFNKALKADLLIHLDNVQFEKNNVQNRNRILINGEARWLTVPVNLKNHLQTTIADVPVDNSRDWKKKYLSTLYHTYCKHPYFEEIYEEIQMRIRKEESRICELNCSLIDYFFGKLGIQTKVMRASALVGKYAEKNQLLIELLKKTGADEYISGPSGRNYLDPEQFRKEKITVTFNDFRASAYPQRRQKTFIPNLSVLDLLFNCSAEEARNIILTEPPAEKGRLSDEDEN